MPIDYSLYPANWKSEIRPAILERAGHKCERCGVPDRWYRIREAGAEEAFAPESEGHFNAAEASAAGIGPKPTLIVLTVAHVFDKSPMNCDLRNLQALCQRCHLALDLEDRKISASERRAAKVAEVQSPLFD